MDNIVLNFVDTGSPSTSSHSTHADALLAQKALQSNKTLQHVLTIRAERLQEELNEIDRLLSAAEIEDDDFGLDMTDLQVPGAKKPKSPFPSAELLNPESPFFEQASRTSQYLKNTTIHSMKAKELDILAEAVRRENQRLQAEKILEQPQSYPNIDLDNNIEGIDWDIVAEKVSNFHNNTRTAEECRIRWLGDRHPKINHSDWKPDELEQLESLVSAQRESTGKVDWVVVAKMLGTNRTPIDCMSHGSSTTKFSWTRELDDKLANAVEKYGVNNWSIVARFITGNVTAAQCQGRYSRKLDPSLKRGSWTEDEDARLRKAVAAYTNSWVDVASFIPGRTNDQCRERWTELSSGPTKNQWTEVQDKALLDAVGELGNQWKAISLKIGGGKTGSTCRFRYEKLKKMRAVSQLCRESETSLTIDSAPKPKPRPKPSRKGKEKAVELTTSEGGPTSRMGSAPIEVHNSVHAPGLLQDETTTAESGADNNSASENTCNEENAADKPSDDYNSNASNATTLARKRALDAIGNSTGNKKRRKLSDNNIIDYSTRSQDALTLPPNQTITLDQIANEMAGTQDVPVAQESSSADAPIAALLLRGNKRKTTDSAEVLSTSSEKQPNGFEAPAAQLAAGQRRSARVAAKKSTMAD